jgi:glycosyltransferase involved in cell wall biosynthesis
MTAIEGTSPLVSIVTATYNRSNVLALTLASVRWQTFRDWELWVVGDACTDDTERVVAAFGDARIHFVNLEQNVGEQSGPNNEGFRRSRGRYIAYLNHDDFWLPDHLETALRGIEETGADLVFALVDQVAHEGPNRLVGATPTGRYEPYICSFSSWFAARIVERWSWRFYRDATKALGELALPRGRPRTCA